MPWLETKNLDRPSMSGRQSIEDREKLDGLYECAHVRICSTSARPTGGTATGTSGRRRSCMHTAGSSTAATKRRASGWTIWKIPFKLYRCHTIMNCAKTCPPPPQRGFPEPGPKAIAEIKKIDVERRL